ncbi:hypothetical protein K7711_45635 [Nocardia sp. CA2R105]|uniref:SPFH domain-containing protein n=1 Tax=Nocardia coffeae TaxID=2873381 RepID=UPI001CA67D33|nr:SPFH domain-containing protein [Nocardia coffeae]MBY8863813.1 hypothetical protein [Nocardia coffeae]
MNPKSTEKLIHYVQITSGNWRQVQPQSDGHWATVSLEKDGRLEPLEQKPTGMFKSRPTGVYWVNKAVHHASFHVEVPTAENALNFHVQAHLSWRITEPVTAVRDNIRAPEFVYRPIVEQELRKMCSGFDVASFLDAENHINDNFASRTIELGHGLTLLECRVQLQPDPDTLEHLRHRTLDRRAEERRLVEHDVVLRDAKLEHRENDAKHDLTKQSVEFEREITTTEEENSIAHEQIRMAHYRQALRDGDLGMFALQLASRNDNVGMVIQQLAVQQEVTTKTAKEILTVLFQKGMVNKRDSDQILAKVNRLIDSATGPAAIGPSASKPDIELTGSAIITDTPMIGAPNTGPDDEDEDDID